MATKTVTTVEQFVVSDLSGDEATAKRTYFHPVTGRSVEMDLTDSEAETYSRQVKAITNKMDKGRNVNPSDEEHAQFIAEAAMFAAFMYQTPLSSIQTVYAGQPYISPTYAAEYRFFLSIMKSSNRGRAKEIANLLGWPSRTVWRNSLRQRFSAPNAEIGKCHMCGRHLSDPKSLIASHGPDCARKVVSLIKTKTS